MSHNRMQSEYRTTASMQGSGCSSGLILPPLAVLFITGLLALFANSPMVTVSAASLPASQPGEIPVTGYTQTSISPIFTAEVQYWGEHILAWSAEFGLDPDLAATVMQIESCGYQQAVSSAGAMGLFQVMPFHFSAEDAPMDPGTNARRGLAYLALSLERAGGDPRLALAGYNGGIGVIARGESTWSEQTHRYVKYGGPIYADAAAGLTTSGAVYEWYSRYGASLCRQAHDSLGLP